MKHISMTLLAVCTVTSDARAQTDTDSANALMPGCKALLAGQYHAETGKCLTIVSTLRNVGTFFAGNLRFCVPVAATNGQVVQVVVTLADSIPQHWHQPFLKLAMGALRRTWPC